jgi:hypothetical protein
MCTQTHPHIVARAKPTVENGQNRLDEWQAALPTDMPSLRTTCHLHPLDLPSQVHLYAQGHCVGVEDSPETPCVRANRLRLRDMLATHLDIQWGKHVVRIEDPKDAEARPTVYFADGTSATGDVVVGADGTNSKVREHLLTLQSNEDVLVPTPVSAIWGRRTLRGAAMKKQLELGHSLWALFEPSGLVLLGALQDILPGGRSGVWVWAVYERDAKAGTVDHWLRSATLEERYTHALRVTEGVDPKFRQILLNDEGMDGDSVAGVLEHGPVFYDALIDEVPGVHRVIMIGDAVHPMTPCKFSLSLTIFPPLFFPSLFSFSFFFFFSLSLYRSRCLTLVSLSPSLFLSLFLCFSFSLSFSLSLFPSLSTLLSLVRCPDTDSGRGCPRKNGGLDQTHLSMSDSSCSDSSPRRGRHPRHPGRPRTQPTASRTRRRRWAEADGGPRHVPAKDSGAGGRAYPADARGAREDEVGGTTDGLGPRGPSDAVAGAAYHVGVAVWTHCPHAQGGNFLRAGHFLSSEERCVCSRRRATGDGHHEPKEGMNRTPCPGLGDELRRNES